MNGTSALKGRFVLRADFIRPYNPCGKLALFNKPLCCVSGFPAKPPGRFFFS